MFLKCLAATGLLLSVATSSFAKDLGNPNSVVYVQEIRNTFQVVFNTYCPMRADRRFSNFCKRADSYRFGKAILNPNTDWVKETDYKYMVQWMPAKTGTYAWVTAQGGNFTASIKNETLLANFAPKTVVVESFFTKGSKAERAAVIARVKAMLKKKYGAVADQMKYRHVQAAAVECVKRRKAPKDGLNCRLR
ncbi:hypothetical protein F9L33_05235 [Amylibacter sp. SFDW26]|uniref:hypothetical protein n=1 Tax=Amylibacter sp. SFDW26 TaxID=2652722 RepID=UPI001261A544|nr:hypothetical protein [Amylibacter sp. SFDW26]KAB7616157.1 hypothetical protein F9L33_05235 [Amylibacter sp. SFDW26]